MKTSPKNFRETFLQSLLDLIWRQWTTLGVAGHGGNERRVIDPDALLLATCVFGRYEPRLFDEMLDWLAVNGWCINVQRMRSLMKRHGYGCGRVLACVGALQAKGADTVKWRRLSLDIEPAPTGAEPLFYFPDGRPQPMFGRPDPQFAAYGLHRGRLELRHLSQPANPELPANLLYRLRALFGVNARADILVYLLTHVDGHPPEMARQTGYFPKTIQMSLVEMACSGVVQPSKRGREKHYRLDAAEWAMLRPKQETAVGWPEWVAWPQFFAAMTGIWDLLQNQNLSKASSALQAAEWQKRMNRLQPLLAESHPDAAIKDFRRLTEASFLQAVQDDLMRCLTAIAS
jgi:hypothetical protein